ncbi:MAG: efflux RND transporter periplasmic adaptor subunit, partial [Planctomycetota bacterium]
MKSTIALNWAALLFAAAACTPEAVPPPSGGDAHQASAAPSSRIDVPPAVRRNLGITFAAVEARAVTRTLRVAGAFELLPLARREYHMNLPGQVELLVDQFDRVEVGTPLFRFRSPQWPELLHEVLLGEQAAEAARADIRVARARFDEAVQTLESNRARVEALARADFKKADLEARVIELEASLPRLEAEFEQAETRLANALGTREHALQRASVASGLTLSELLEEVPGEVAGAGPRPRYESVDWIEIRAT